MTFAAVAVVAVGAGAAAYSASEKNAAGKKAGQAQAKAYAEAKAALTQGKKEATGYLNPYADAGKAALNELSWQMGLSPTHTTTAADVPNTYQPGQSNDPLWEKILTNFNNQHSAVYGTGMNRPWESDSDSQSAYQSLVQEYLKQKGPDTPYKGSGEFGGLTQTFDAEKYQKDPGYTPMVNSLEELQATPGYQFQLEQGLQSVNNSAAAKGSLLSGGQLKAVNDYAQGRASTGYQDAWNRAQTAYSNAFSRFNTNQNNAFQRLQSMSNNGQSAAGQQGGYAMDAAGALAGAATNNGNNQAQLALYKGENNAQMATSIGNSVSSGIGGYATGGYGGAGMGGGTGGGGWYGGGSNGLNNQQLSSAITPTFNSGWYG